MKRTWIVVGVLVLVVAVGAGAFWAGMSYGKSQASQDRASLMQERLGARGIQLPAGDQLPQGGQRDTAQFGGGISGTIEIIEGETLVINTDEGIIRVQTADTTLIEKNMSVGVGDLEVGEMVVVSGSRNEDGSVTARSIMSGRAFQLGQPQGGE